MSSEAPFPRKIEEYQAYIHKELSEYADRESFPTIFKGDTIQLVIFGETKQTQRHTEQAELARKIIPGIIVLQGLGDFTFNPLTNEFRPNPMYDLQPGLTEFLTALRRLTRNTTTSPDGLAPFLKVSTDLQIPLIGCNIPQSEIAAHIFPQYPKFVLSRENENHIALKKAIRRTTRRYQSLYIERFLTALPKDPLHPTMAVIKETDLDALYLKDNLDSYCMIPQVSPPSIP